MLDKSKIVVLQKISIDGYPMKKRFPEAFEYLENNFTLIFNDDNKIKIYKKRF